MAIFREICGKSLVLSLFLAYVLIACKPSYTYEGERSYIVNCQPCHGPTGEKSVGGAANLQEVEKDTAHWRQVVMQGIPEKMPSFRSRISDKEWDALKDYLLYLNAE